ncbi:MAG: hypothetical protein COA79_26535 [Planctomycetota bacterium]|nr:MAG: hypothetical protein COA79_26535 [Planctomycetota bacterium]
MMNELGKYSNEIIWMANNGKLLHDLIAAKQSNLTIFPFDIANLTKYSEMNILRPLSAEIIKQLHRTMWQPALPIFARDETFFGVPEDISFYGIIVPKKQLEDTNKWDWDELRSLINKNYKENNIDFWSAGATNNMGFIYSVLGAFGINIEAPLKETIELKENWLKAYDWLNSIEWDWEEFFINNLSPLEFKQYSSNQKLEMGWTKAPPNPFNNYQDYNFFMFPDDSSVKKRFDFCIGSCWASIKNNMPDQVINDLFRIILDYKNLLKVELRSATYFNINKKLWKDKAVLKAKPLYKHIDFFNNAKNVVYSNINKMQHHDIRDILLKTLTNKANNKIFFSYLEGLITTGKTFYKSNDLQTAIEFITTNYQNINQIKDITDYLDCSQSHLQSLFKMSFDCSCWEYLNKIRVDIAKNELVYNSQSISQISIKIGFKSSVTFTRVFKKNTGSTPSEYRLSKKTKKWQ